MDDGAEIVAAAEEGEKARVFAASAEVAMVHGRQDARARDVLAAFARAYDVVAGEPVLAGRPWRRRPAAPGEDLEWCCDERGRGVVARWGPSDGNPRDGMFRGLDVRTVGLPTAAIHTSFAAEAAALDEAAVGYGTWLWIEVRSDAGLAAMMTAWGALADALAATGHQDETVEQRGQQWIELAERLGHARDAKALAARAGAAIAARLRRQDDGTLVALELARRPFVHLAQILASLRHPERIERLDVSGNGLTTLPLALSTLTGLRTLTAADNALDAWPGVLEHLPSLRHLDLSRNPLGRIPGAVVHVAELRSLSVSRAGLTEVAGEIAALGELHTLTLADNALETLPDGLYALKSLQWLDLRGNAVPEARVASIKARLPGCTIQSGARRRA